MFVCFTACFGNSPATKFYRLSIDEFSELGMVSKTLGIMPVTIPAYLKQAQIVTQSSSTEYKLSDFNQYIGDLDVSKVKRMVWMFRFNNFFNMSLKNWDTRNVKDMENMFNDARSFN